MRTGRPPKFDKKTFQEIYDRYFEDRKYGSSKGPMTKLDFCCFAGVDKDYIQTHNLRDGSKHDFSVTIKQLETESERDLEIYGLLGTFNPTMTIFCLKNNYGWKDKSETEITGAGGKDLIPRLTPEQLDNIGGEMKILASKNRSGQQDS